jgi:hypothetical protein
MAEQSQNPGIITNTFSKGMVKDYNETFVGEGLYTHARNAVNNSHDGQLGVIGNEPANLYCVTLPYTLIGCIHLTDDQWVVFTTDDVDSEIGIFDESQCTYTKVVNDPCLGFKRSNLITGASRKRFDCDRPVYWVDALNPDRFMDIGNPPFKYIETIEDGCAIKTYLQPLQLDCEKLRLSPLIAQPCLNIKKGVGSGTLANGSYQALIAYTINGVRVTDYMGTTEVQPIWSHENLNGSLEIEVSSVDQNFDEFELVIISIINQQTVAKKIGIYSSNQGKIYIDTIGPELITIPLNQVLLRTDPIERSDSMYTVNDYLLKVGTRSKYKFNYQPLANNIKVQWNAVQYPAQYYYKGGNNTGYLRDEQYSFFIRWVYNTGERSDSYHIPGRQALASDLVLDLSSDAYESKDGVQKQRWQVQNTATLENIGGPTLSDGGVVIASGNMAYWESTEKYPDNKPDIWDSLCGKNIRHHKMPDETVSPLLNIFNSDGSNIVILGVSFSNIQIPVDLSGNPITSVVGYEILRGSREGQKSIIAKGLLNNLREYDIPGSSTRGLYQNYPYNDLDADTFLTSNLSIIDPEAGSVVNPLGDDAQDELLDSAERDNDEIDEIDEFDEEDDDDDDSKRAERRRRRQERKLRRRQRREAKAKLRAARKDLRRSGDSNGVNLAYPLTLYKKDHLSFHSPDTTFTRPFLGVSELKVYQEIYGKSRGLFSEPYKHPKFKTLTNFSGIFSSVIAVISSIGNVLSAIANNGNITLGKTDKLNYEKQLTLAKMTNHPVSFSLFGSGASVPNPVIAITNSIIGTYNLTVSVAMSYVEATAVGEQMLNVIYGMVPKRQNALQYDSHGHYNKSIITNEGDRRFRIDDSSYVDSNIQSFNSNYNINNVFRSGYVAIQIERDKNNPISIDNSTISGHYGAIKVVFSSQYGQLDQIKQVPVSACVHSIISDAKSQSTSVLFNGDTYINRFTEKNSFFFFNSWLMGEPDETEHDYRNYINIAYPRFWINSERPSYKLFGNMSNNRHLDERDSSTFFVSKGYFYLFNSGVRDFFVESEVNLAFRDWEELVEKRHYDPYNYSDYKSLFRSDIIKSRNFYKYDYSLSVSKIFNQYVSYGNLLPRYYDPKKFSTCFTYYPTRVAYSLPQQLEGVKDNWRVFLANNYKDFGSPITSIKNINKTGALFMMSRQSPLQFLGVDQLQTDAGTKITVGDGGLFNQPLQSITNSDESYEYGSCQNKLATLGCTHGVFWVSQNQGKIFQYAGQIKEISRDGLKWWFAKYLPSELLRIYPDYPFADNPVIAVGVQMIYDNTNEIIYVSKKDYKPLKTNLLFDSKGFYEVSASNGKVYIPLTNTAYFEDASWTMSYDPKSQTWISFHDWIPSFLIPGKAHFMSVNQNSIWKHNIRCDKYSNYYGVDYPFEIEFVSASGQQVVSMRNIEYILEAYKMHNDCRDKFHVLDANFDQAIVYNSEQVSGLLELELKNKANPVAMLSYPQIRPQSIGINYSKEEQKYRFNQFWDITKDRGEFTTSTNIPMFITESNGYKFKINPAYVNYQKSPLERKKFRHNLNKVFLRKFKSDDVKMLFKISNQKIQLSQR